MGLSKKDYQFDIGNRWEEICNEIARIKYKDILLDDDYETRLVNNKLPDIIVNDCVEYSGVLIKHANVIIECKKSLSYTSRTLYDADLIDENKHCKVKYIMSEEFIEDNNLLNT